MSLAALTEYWSADVTAAVVTSAGLVLAAAVTAYAHVAHKLRGIGRDVTQAREQVKNDHGTNLRDDVDDVKGIAEEARDLGEEARDLARSNQNAILALAAEVKHLGDHRRRRWWR